MKYARFEYVDTSFSYETTKVYFSRNILLKNNFLQTRLLDGDVQHILFPLLVLLLFILCSKSFFSFKAALSLA